MSEYNFGDIYLVRFHPKRGSEIGKYRPALIVNSIPQKIDKRLITICPLTTRTQKKSVFELKILKKGELKKDSLALLWYVRTVDIDRLVLKLGELSDSKNKGARKLLAELWA